MTKTANDKINTNKLIFREYFGWQDQSFLAKCLHKANQVKNKQLVNQVNDGLIDLRNDINKKIINLIKHGKGLKILTPKQMFQRLSIALAQADADNTY